MTNFILIVEPGMANWVLGGLLFKPIDIQLLSTPEIKINPRKLVFTLPRFYVYTTVCNLFFSFRSILMFIVGSQGVQMVSFELGGSPEVIKKQV